MVSHHGIKQDKKEDSAFTMFRGQTNATNNTPARPEWHRPTMSQVREPHRRRQIQASTRCPPGAAPTPARTRTAGCPRHVSLASLAKIERRLAWLCRAGRAELNEAAAHRTGDPCAVNLVRMSYEMQPFHKRPT